MKVKYLILSILTLVMNCAYGQIKAKDSIVNEFEQFKKRELSEFQEFKDKRDEEFSNLLKNQWKTFELNKGNEPPSAPKPPKQPKELPSAPIQKEKDIPKVIQPLPKKIIPIDDSKIELDNLEKLPLSSIINFYDKRIEIKYAKEFKITHTTLDEKGISDYWKKISGSDYDLFIIQLKKISLKLKLNDWGNYDLVEKISRNILNNDNDRALFCFFMLNHWGYDAKVGRKNDKITLLLPFENTVYFKSFLNLSNKKYYIMDNKQEGLIFTFEQNFSNSNKKMNLKLEKSPVLGLNYISKSFFVKKLNKNIEIRYNNNLINFNNNYPCTDLNIFFTSIVDPLTEKDIIESFAPLLKDKNELEAVNILLDFVENSFEYKTDYDQFGYEKFFFPEDIFNYKYSDCEDRAVLFSYLVKTLLKLDIIGLDYTTHVATAIKFNSNINGDSIMVNNQTYIICDPTYIGSSAGMCMPQFKNVNPVIIH